MEIKRGYQPGIIGRIAEMHALYYAREYQFGRFFESKVAAETAEFTGRLGNDRNALWAAVDDGRLVGTVAIDSEDLDDGSAHLRWFIIDDDYRGRGIGRRLLAEAVTFCDRQDFPSAQLWTFRGLDAARHLYEAFGFVLAEEHPGAQWGTPVVEQRFVRQAGNRPAEFGA
jgi:GNAT superfamily N-acetyltransferase